MRGSEWPLDDADAEPLIDRAGPLSVQSSS